MTDLFGNEHPDPSPSAKAGPQLNLVDAAAERLALASGRPRSQERAEILAGYAYATEYHDGSEPVGYDTLGEACAAVVRTGGNRRIVKVETS